MGFPDQDAGAAPLATAVAHAFSAAGDDLCVNRRSLPEQIIASMIRRWRLG